MDMDPERWARSPFFVGALGGLVSLKFSPGDSWAVRLFNVLASCCMAGFVSPGLAEWAHLNSPVLQSALAFLVGLLGLSVAAAALAAVKETRLSEIATGWLSRKG